MSSPEVEDEKKEIIGGVQEMLHQRSGHRVLLTADMPVCARQKRCQCFRERERERGRQRERERDLYGERGREREREGGRGAEIIFAFTLSISDATLDVQFLHTSRV